MLAALIDDIGLLIALVIGALVLANAGRIKARGEQQTRDMSARGYHASDRRNRP